MWGWRMAGLYWAGRDGTDCGRCVCSKLRGVDRMGMVRRPGTEGECCARVLGGVDCVACGGEGDNWEAWLGGGSLRLSRERRGSAGPDRGGAGVDWRNSTAAGKRARMRDAIREMRPERDGRQK